MDYNDEVARAIRHFWSVRASQHEKQGATTGTKDSGTRGAVTGGKHLDGFISLLAKLLSEAGLPDSAVHTRTTTLPGYFRATKDWDLVLDF